MVIFNCVLATIASVVTRVNPLSLITDHLFSSLLLSVVKILFKYDPLLKHISLPAPLTVAQDVANAVQYKYQCNTKYKYNTNINAMQIQIQNTEAYFPPCHISCRSRCRAALPNQSVVRQQLLPFKHQLLIYSMNKIQI